MPVLIDTHCHLDFPQFDADRDEVLARMRKAGVRLALLVAVEPKRWEQLAALANGLRFPFSVGVHPNECPNDEPSAEEIAAWALREGCVAIGETGMDFYRERVPHDLQLRRLQAHIEAARATNKPLIVHMRNASAALLQALQEMHADEVGGVMHCFSEDWEVAKKALDLGFYLSFAGNLSYPRNEAIREVASRAPLDRILVETDAPFLAPQPVRGKRNEPAFVRHTAEAIAKLRRISLQELAEATTANAVRLFRLQSFLEEGDGAANE